MAENLSAPLRSWLFAPAGHARRVEKALAGPAQAVILDLEDAVALNDKAAAREALRTTLDRQHRPNLFVRINALSTPFAGHDLNVAVGPGIAGIMLPKSESAEDIRRLDDLVTGRERTTGLKIGAVGIVPLIESAAGLEAVSAICAASPRIRCLAFGAADFTLDLGITWSDDELELLPYRSRLVLAARAAGLDAPIDTPWIQLQDQEGMVASALRARTLGFQGKLCIHPDQVDAVHRAYAPSSTQIEAARRIVSASEAAGSAVVQLDGRMIDYPVVAAARRLLLDVERQSALVEPGN